MFTSRPAEIWAAICVLGAAGAGCASGQNPAPGARPPDDKDRRENARALALIDRVQAAGGPAAEVRGTWVTTTANTAIATPEDSARTMRRLREIGLNTVYVETWKNGYTQYPSEVLKRTIGVDRRPALVPQDPSDRPEALRAPGRDLLEETLIEAHRQGLLYVAWFEYGFMAAHKDTQNHLRRTYPQWLSRDAKGNEVAKNGFVWMNPLHPEPRRFLLDLVLEAAEKYDLDGVQLDDRIVWPYIDMGYDDFTKQAYAAENGGRMPPEDPKDAGWMRWRADKVNEYSRQFVQEIRGAHPEVLTSLSPAVYPWCFEFYLLEWPKWAAWTASDTLPLPQGSPGHGVAPRWDEFIPQVYRFNYKAFEQTWVDQVRHMRELGAGRVGDLIAGIRVVGEGKDSTWEDLRDSIALVRRTGGGGHVHWFSRGVLEVYPDELTKLYAESGAARHPARPEGWRRPSTVLTRGENGQWRAMGVVPGRYRIIVDRDTAEGGWSYQGEASARAGPVTVTLPEWVARAELLVDRRPATAAGGAR